MGAMSGTMFPGTIVPINMADTEEVGLAPMPPNLWPFVYVLAGLVVGLAASGPYETIRLSEGPVSAAVTNRLTGTVRLCVPAEGGPPYRFVCR